MVSDSISVSQGLVLLSGSQIQAGAPTGRQIYEPLSVQSLSLLEYRRLVGGRVGKLPWRHMSITLPGFMDSPFPASWIFCVQALLTTLVDSLLSAIPDRGEASHSQGTLQLTDLKLLFFSRLL